MARHTLHFPVGGLHRSFAPQHQPPFFTPACSDVRDVDVQEGRQQGGVRPTLVPTFPDSVPRPIEHLFTLNVIDRPDESFVHTGDGFDGTTLQPYWSVGTVVPQWQIVNGVLAFHRQQTDHALFYRDPLPGFDGTRRHIHQLEFLLPPDADWKHEVHLLIGMNQPDFMAGSVQLVWNMTGRDEGQFNTGILAAWNNGEQNLLSSVNRREFPSTGKLRLWMEYNADDDEIIGNLYHDPVQILWSMRYRGISKISPPSGPIMGFSVLPKGNDVFMDGVLWSYTSVTQGFFDKPRPVLVSIAGNRKVYSNRTPGRMLSASQPGRGPSGASNVSGVGYNGLLFIADPETPLVFNPGSTVYADALRLQGPIEGNTVIDWREAPHRYYRDDQGQQMELKGPFPPDRDDLPYPHLSARYGGRLVIAGSPEHVWYMSRIGDPFDWDQGQIDSDQGGTGRVTADDVGRSVWGVTGEFGDIPGPITALISFTDDYLLFGLLDSMERLVGDPLAGGRILNVSTAVGIADRNAWTLTPESELVFLSVDEGLFKLGTGGSSFPEPISHHVLPREFKSIDPRRHRTSIVFDHTEVGIHIFIEDIHGGPSQQWWFSWRQRRYFPASLHESHIPRSSVWYGGDALTAAAVVLGCRDGGFRHFGGNSLDDDGLPISPFVDYGPLRGATDAENVVLNWIRVFEANGREVSIGWRTGDTARDAFKAVESGRTVADGKAIRPKVGGGSIYLRVTPVDSPFILDAIEIDIDRRAVRKPL